MVFDSEDKEAHDEVAKVERGRGVIRHVQSVHVATEYVGCSPKLFVDR